MSAETVGMAAAALTVVFTVAGLVLGLEGVRSLGEIASELRRRREELSRTAAWRELLTRTALADP